LLVIEVDPVKNRNLKQQVAAREAARCQMREALICAKIFFLHTIYLPAELYTSEKPKVLAKSMILDGGRFDWPDYGSTKRH